MKKKIAIGILAFNVEKYIESVVEDLASLGLQFIIIDDSSTDETLKILRRLNKQYEIIIIKNKFRVLKAVLLFEEFSWNIRYKKSG